MENKDKMTQNYEQRKQLLLMPVREMKQYVTNTFEVRHNVVTDVYEFRRKEGDETWRALDERGFNTIACGVEDANIFCLDSRIKHWLRSDFAMTIILCASGLKQFVANGTARIVRRICSVASRPIATVARWGASGCERWSASGWATTANTPML